MKPQPLCPHCERDLVVIPVCRGCLNMVEGMKLETIIFILGCITVGSFLFGTLTIWMR